MTKLFRYIGDASIPYRTIMKDHEDFFVGDFQIRIKSLVIAEQTHSQNVHICAEADNGAGFHEHPQIMDCDALVTNIPNQFLLIRTADCTPVLFFDLQNQAVGAIHSGREGTRKNIVLATVRTMQQAYGTKPSQLLAWIGPGVCRDHYPVNPQTGQEFYDACLKSGLKLKTFDIRYPDIQAVLRLQLLASGLKEDNIVMNKTCTYESLTHFSYRRDGTHNRQVNLIGMYNGKYHL